jgi:hypothetical protein
MWLRCAECQDLEQNGSLGAKKFLFSRFSAPPCICLLFALCSADVKQIVGRNPGTHRTAACHMELIMRSSVTYPPPSLIRMSKARTVARMGRRWVYVRFLLENWKELYFLVLHPVARTTTIFKKDTALHTPSARLLSSTFL